MILMDSWVCEVSGSQLWLYKTNASWLECETQDENHTKITGRLLEQRATHWIREELHPETYIEKNEFGKPELAAQKAQSTIEKVSPILPYINYSHTLILDNKTPNSSANIESYCDIQGSNLDDVSNTKPTESVLNQHSKMINSLAQKQQEKDCWVLWGTNPNQPIGVDIESLRPQIEKIKSKFCRPEEIAFALSPLQTLIIWSAKEAMYKAYGKKEIDFREQMRVHPFIGFSENQELKNPIHIRQVSENSSLSKGTQDFSDKSESNIPQNPKTRTQTVQFHGELWGDKHYHFDLFARWLDPFVVVWALESKSDH